MLLDAIEAGAGYHIEHDETLYICPPPVVRLDEQNRFHSDQRPAIEWSGASKFYFIHGEDFDEALWRRIVDQKITVKQVMAIENADKRVMAWSMLRPDRAIKGLGAELIHTGIKGTRLYKVDDFAQKIAGDDVEYDGDGVEYCMVMADASTDRQFLEWVDPAIGRQGDADLAQASAWGMERDEYLRVEQEA
ncbi:hypothetical protein HWD35_10455 [Tsukamurella tyrosinosolvens]|uniref:hypothetical protein n=1 Tax=Tsukamurella tyrosinosolvens TaxID=57704 RepID=UPI001CE123C4|nr:hypothetical protein [Tsukamurella tyrosinosolvens]MCA4995133.1 hypothetical protein [Tsukamurella tyrosinosolvens]